MCVIFFFFFFCEVIEIWDLRIKMKGEEVLVYI